MQPPSKKLRGPETTQSQASAPPRGLKMRIASWNLGVPMENSNMGPLKVPTTLHYQEELRKARREQDWSIILLQEVNEHWARVAVEKSGVGLLVERQEGAHLGPGRLGALGGGGALPVPGGGAERQNQEDSEGASGPVLSHLSPLRHRGAWPRLF